MKDKMQTNRFLDEQYYSWLKRYKYSRNDDKLDHFLEVERASVKGESMLKVARTSLLFSQRSASKKLGGSEYRFKRLEEMESRGSIPIQKLREAAAAIDCELVYSIRPKCRRRYSQVVFEKLATPNLRKKYLKFAVRAQVDKSGFRDENNWSKRLPSDIAEKNFP